MCRGLYYIFGFSREVISWAFIFEYYVEIIIKLEEVDDFTSDEIFREEKSIKN